MSRTRGAHAPVTLDLVGLTHACEAVGRLPDGKACFVPYAIPGERVVVEVTEEHARWARARLVEVVAPSPDRVEPPCPYVGPEQPGGPPRCGGCALQHVAPGRQAVMKRRVLVEQLERIGRFVDPPVAATRTVAALGYRAHARFGTTGTGRLGFRRPRSREVVAVDRCLLLTDAAQRVREQAGDDWRGATEVSVHTGAQGEGVLVVPGPQGLAPLPEGDLPVAIAGRSRPAALRGDATVVHEVAGLRLQVSPGSFFQPGPLGAEALVELVRAAAEAGESARVLDLFSGVGLFAAALASDGATVTAVESHAGAAADARANLAGWPRARVERARVERVVGRLATARSTRGAGEPEPYDVVVCDPPRRGVGAELCARLALVAPRVVYVSCDPAALARDARALADAGLPLRAVTPVDQFAQTAAIEAVALFSRDAALPGDGADTDTLRRT